MYYLLLALVNILINNFKVLNININNLILQLISKHSTNVTIDNIFCYFTLIKFRTIFHHFKIPKRNKGKRKIISKNEQQQDKQNKQQQKKKEKLNMLQFAQILFDCDTFIIHSFHIYKDKEQENIALQYIYNELFIRILQKTDGDLSLLPDEIIQILKCDDYDYEKLEEIKQRSLSNSSDLIYYYQYIIDLYLIKNELNLDIKEIGFDQYLLNNEEILTAEQVYQMIQKSIKQHLNGIQQLPIINFYYNYQEQQEQVEDIVNKINHLDIQAVDLQQQKNDLSNQLYNILSKISSFRNNLNKVSNFDWSGLYIRYDKLIDKINKIRQSLDEQDVEVD